MKSKEKIKYFAVIGLFIFLLVNLVSAQSQSSVWQQYGGILTRMTHSQSSSSFSNLNNTNSEIVTSIIGSNFAINNPTQPLITDFLNDSSFANQKLVVLQDGNFLEFLDTNLNIISEINTGNSIVGQIQIGDFNYDLFNNEIAGLYRINDTSIELRYYQYNISSSALTLLNSTLYTEEFTINSTGVKCIGGSSSFCTFQLGNTTNVSLITHYSNGNEFIGNSNGSYGKEPLAIEDINHDGFYEGLTYGTSKFTIWNLTSGLPIITINADASYTLQNARIVRIDSSVLFKVAVFETLGSSSCRVKTWRIDGSVLWTDSCGGVVPSPYVPFGMGIYDYNNDFFDDLWIAYDDNSADILKIFDGTDGTLLFSSTSEIDLVSGGVFTSTPQGFNIARMSSSTTPAIIYTTSTNLINIYSPSQNDTFIYNQSTGGSSGLMGCAIGDLNFDSYNDVVCTDNGFTIGVLSNSSNENSVMTSVTFSPSTIVPINSEVQVLISCIDAESDSILYSIRCDSGDSFTESYSSSQLCSYLSTGYKNMTLRCRDAFHSEYSEFSQIISVTLTGAICNNNGVCDSGETNNNCPNDCISSATNHTQATGGMAIPTKLVDTETSTEQGLLPEIYYGILAFLSTTLSPMMVLIFLFLSVFIIIAIGTLIKKVVSKIG